MQKEFSLCSGISGILMFLARICFASALIVAVSESNAQDTTALIIINNVPVILGTINDKPAYFLVDTGASITLLNESQCNAYGFEVVPNRFFAKGRVTGMGGRSYLKEARHAKVRLGTHELDFINKATDLDLLSAMFGDPHITIAGIIGTDLLYLLESSIDLSLGIIVFRAEKSMVHSQ